MPGEIVSIENEKINIRTKKNPNIGTKKSQKMGIP
jgi:hypothetical protein